MEIIEQTLNGAKIYRLKGRLDSNTSQMLEDKLFLAISDGINKIVVDFENLSYISSAGLRVIFKANKALNRKDGRIILCSMQKYVRDTFKITGIDSFVPIFATLDDAIKSLF